MSIKIKDIIKETKKINKEYNYFNYISEDLANNLSKKSRGKLANIAISVKDCVCVKDIPSQAGSAILSGYKPLVNATVINKVINEGGIIIGKTSQDEFGFGRFSTNVGVGFKIPKNPHDKKRVCGGSSGGAAGFTAKVNFSHIAIAESTGGSIATPASYCGVVGFTPTYGVVSRYGLIDYANSLDKIGTIGKTVSDAFSLFSVIKGKDDKDATKRISDVEVKVIKSNEIDAELKLTFDCDDIDDCECDNLECLNLLCFPPSSPTTTLEVIEPTTTTQQDSQINDIELPTTTLQGEVSEEKINVLQITSILLLVIAFVLLIVFIIKKSLEP